MMNKIEARSVIKFLHLKGNNARQIHDEMKAVYGDESPSYDMVVRWKRNFQSGHMSLTDKPRAGRPSIKDDLAMVKKVEAVILDDRRSTMEKVMAETGLSYGTAWRIIHEELHRNKVSACWVPRLLTALQKQTRHDFSQQNLTLLERNEDNFFACLVTKDECWVYLYDPDTKEMSKEWKHPSSPPPSQGGEDPEICQENDAVHFLG
ncbi:hypothetical protein JRQ81_001900 [Phrynocephalus forsythii]|uniref:Mos1 transposase HTH domain-containing protein n=1 Tax=Phrynocephalus forsythii TaxID=171643 RepID=A0A9Q0Y822_9SAUR|nr:hypothetical protein JRQ81_001900 [Phrynocephalus forsythii]